MASWPKHQGFLCEILAIHTYCTSITLSLFLTYAPLPSHNLHDVHHTHTQANSLTCFLYLSLQVYIRSAQAATLIPPLTSHILIPSLSLPPSSYHSHCHTHLTTHIATLISPLTQSGHIPPLTLSARIPPLTPSAYIPPLALSAHSTTHHQHTSHHSHCQHTSHHSHCHTQGHQCRSCSLHLLLVGRILAFFVPTHFLQPRAEQVF